MIIVVADDITGAAEIAGICLRYDISVLFGIDQIPAGEALVKVVATNSRSASLSNAIEIHANLAAEIMKLKPEFVYKKCDSVLRGYVQAEVKAMTTLFGIPKVVLQPANPAVQRIILNDNYYVGSQLLHETSFAQDPDFPAKSSNVHILLHENSQTLCSELIIDDCTSVSELSAQAGSVLNDFLVVGSSAFFEQIILQKYPGINKNKVAESGKAATQFLMIIGSTHESGLKFIESKSSELKPEIIRENDLSDGLFEVLLTDISNRLLQNWLVNGRLIVSFSPELSAVRENQQKYLDRSFHLLSKVLTNPDLKEIFVTGGATAYSLLKYMGWNLLTPSKERAQGVVSMKVEKTGVWITLKPGSYPWPENIV